MINKWTLMFTIITIENISNYTIQFINNNLILTPIDIVKESTS